MRVGVDGLALALAGGAPDASGNASYIGNICPVEDRSASLDAPGLTSVGAFTGNLEGATAGAGAAGAGS